MKDNGKNSFVDIKFFLGLLLAIYGAILVINGLYSQLTDGLEIFTNIDLLYGAFLVSLGIIFYRTSSKPKEWNRAD
jgi:hypothetical protein